jgi:TPR repeat protein
MGLTITFVSYLALGVASAIAQDSPAAQPPRQETARPSPLSASEISQLQARAEAGDAVAQTKLGKAYQDGNGVPQNDNLALKWYCKAAEQGDPSAENDLGIMYRLGEGVTRDKEEAVRWYHKAAKHGSPQAMFNLGACYYNGEGVASNEYFAYAWFLLAKDAGDKVADDAVRRSAAGMSPRETADALMQIADMYQKGEELPKSEDQSMQWMHRAAEIDSGAKLRIAVHFLTGPDSQHDYGQALDLCKKAAKDYAPGLACVGYIYRKAWASLRIRLKQ